ncbi:hypothetical protein C2845_PM05G03970 [Panicum miliaceum]|uniref:NAC domain-containing protein n=1 Tax=Panicum miliaceum TaxID=4540 RepID=A0A3L6SXD6_PANMI|nr:hypothetical protein C2845_PM05G03970 [Panicum miliaceum]
MAAPFQPLPPGVYFNPSAEECVRDYLRPWNAGVRPGTDRIIVDVNIYSDRPDALVRGREPGFSRGFDYKWLMLTHCIRLCGGRGRGKARAKRDVATGGNWKVEQRAKGVAEHADGEDDPPAGGLRRTNGFYLGSGRGKGKKDAGVKTPWLMEELTTEEDEADAAGGWRGERLVKVFCKLYVSPRASDEKKMEIFGEDGVPFDREGKAKTLVVDLPAELFDAITESVYGAQGPGPAPPPPAPRVLGHRQGQPAAPPLLRVQYGETALRHHHGHAALPRVVHAHQHSHGEAHPGFLGNQRGQGAPRQIQGGPGHYYADEVQPQRRHVLDPYQTQEASPGFAFAGYYNRQDEVLYQYSAFVRLDPQQGEEMIPMEKKPRLEYDSLATQPQGGADSDRSSCVVQASTSQEQGQCGDTDANAKVFQEPEHVAKSSPPQEISGTATGPPELAHEACKVAAESMRDHDCDFITDFVDLQEPFVDAVPDILMCGTLNPPSGPSGDEPPLHLGFDEFLVDDFMKDVPDF